MLPRLDALLRSLDSTVQAATREVSFNAATDHFAFMVLTFLSKQRLHAESIVLLQPSRDVILISRSMMEGLCLLLWTEADPSVRALRWRSFAYISDLRQLEENDRKGVETPPDRRKQIIAAVEQFGEPFLTRKLSGRLARIFRWVKGLLTTKGRNTAGISSDRYVWKWYPGSLGKIFKAAKADVIYSGIYGIAAEYHHWSVRGLVGSIRRSEGRVRFERNSFSDSGAAMFFASGALLQTAEIADRHLNLGIAPKLAEHRREMEDAYRAFKEGS